MKTIIAFLKREKVFTISLAAAIISCVPVPPDEKYTGYADFRTLALLYCLMAVVAGLRKAGLFQYMARGLCGRAADLRGLCLGLVLITFAASMLITNDVALISFVPFSLMVLSMAGAEEQIIWVVVCQTVAANLGSMLTPVGNPQNLYLFSRYGLSFADFFGITLPVWLLSLAAVVLLMLPVPKTPVNLGGEAAKIPSKRQLAVLGLLFAICLLCVFRVIGWPVMLALVAIILLIFDRSLLLTPDFALLATFMCFFVFSGNLARIPKVNEFLSALMAGREFVVSAAASQIISNVPAALLLSSFTDNARSLILGTDIGGLGTPVASLASLISYKLYCNYQKAQPGKFMGTFLALNFALLALFGFIAIKFLGA